jgi:nucleoside-diphosphate-sugar epimerase
MERLLIVGCGDVARRAIPLLTHRYDVCALIRDRSQHSRLAKLGVETMAGDLDRPSSLAKLAGCADILLHSAPPPNSGIRDTRTANLLRTLSRGRILPWRIVYLSTTGVYGDCSGMRIDERAPLAPATDRARRRADAEERLLRWGRANGTSVAILRVPGIYAADRLPLARLRKGAPALREEDDVYTNHIHADDLARIMAAAIERAHFGRSGRAYNACDDSQMKMGEYFDLVADVFGLPRPARISREESQAAISPLQRSFMTESRRIGNARMKRELCVKLRYPTVVEGVADARRKFADSSD